MHVYIWRFKFQIISGSLSHYFNRNCQPYLKSCHRFSICANSDFILRVYIYPDSVYQDHISHQVVDFNRNLFIADLDFNRNWFRFQISDYICRLDWEYMYIPQVLLSHLVVLLLWLCDRWHRSHIGCRKVSGGTAKKKRNKKTNTSEKKYKVHNFITRSFHSNAPHRELYDMFQAVVAVIRQRGVWSKSPTTNTAMDKIIGSSLNTCNNHTLIILAISWRTHSLSTSFSALRSRCWGVSESKYKTFFNFGTITTIIQWLMLFTNMLCTSIESCFLLAFFFQGPCHKVHHIISIRSNVSQAHQLWIKKAHRHNLCLCFYNHGPKVKKKIV